MNQAEQNRRQLAGLNRKIEAQRREIGSLRGALQDEKIVAHMLRIQLADMSALTPQQIEQWCSIVKERILCEPNGGEV